MAGVGNVSSRFVASGSVDEFIPFTEMFPQRADILNSSSSTWYSISASANSCREALTSEMAI